MRHAWIARSVSTDCLALTYEFCPVFCVGRHSRIQNTNRLHRLLTQLVACHEHSQRTERLSLVPDRVDQRVDAGEEFGVCQALLREHHLLSSINFYLAHMFHFEKFLEVNFINGSAQEQTHIMRVKNQVHLPFREPRPHRLLHLQQKNPRLERETAQCVVNLQEGIHHRRVADWRFGRFGRGAWAGSLQGSSC